jgi:hypothetical protein
MGRLYTENQLPSLPGKVYVVVGGWFRENSVIAFGLDLAKTNNMTFSVTINYVLNGESYKSL